MTHHWYIRRPQEVLIDLDHGARGRTFALILAHPSTRSQEIVPSHSPGHYHVRVWLHEEITDTRAVALALRWGGDPAHAGHDLMRIERRIPAPILLITVHPFGRGPDRVCNCSGKHDTLDRMLACHAGRELRPHDLRDWYGDPRGWA